MDTIEELNGTYFYKGIYNLSAGELFFWVFLDAVHEQLNVSDLLAAACIVLGQPERPTRGKPAGTTKGTSIASEMSRRYLNIELPFRLPSLTNASARNLKFKYVNNLGAFVGRAIPVLGWFITGSDVVTIAFKATKNYNRIARGNDKLW
ncbi:STM2901 family protein [Erwinia sp. CGal63]|uniref:STM2901 family protein n=1 Tax=Erwinia sp. CGal63 TaxID=2919889 RepID=UPI00300BD3C9